MKRMNDLYKLTEKELETVIASTAQNDQQRMIIRLAEDLKAERARVKELEAEVSALTANMPKSAIDLEQENFKLKATLKRVEALPNEWTTGTVGSSLGLEGTAGMCEGMKRCAKELKAALKND